MTTVRLVLLPPHAFPQDYGYYTAPPRDCTGLNVTDCTGITICGLANQQRAPPSLISVMISMVLPIFTPITWCVECCVVFFFFVVLTVPQTSEQEVGLFGLWMSKLQTALILTALFCIPWMLLLKPLLLWRDSKRGYVVRWMGGLGAGTRADMNL